MTGILQLIGRTTPLFDEDLRTHNKHLREKIGRGSFLVIGGAGSIGQAVVKELFKRGPKRLHAVDLSENNMVELVRDIRSSLGYIKGDFQTFALDGGSREFTSYLEAQPKFDYIFNLSALKHVRSEKDPYTLMRMIGVNILNPESILHHAAKIGCKKYFCVSTDKAANPVNMMGASKRIMELFLMRASERIAVSTARFANVAFSDGSLLHGFHQRIQKGQPLSAPNDVKRYFVTPGESGELCVLSGLLGMNRDIFFPKLSEKLHQITFSEIAIKFLEGLGYSAVVCESEEEARKRGKELQRKRKWPCYFFNSDTTGEKDFEEFFTDGEILDLKRFRGIGVVKSNPEYQARKLEGFSKRIAKWKATGRWTKAEVVDLFREMIPNFLHEEKGKNLDQKM
jgi:FlaA1/EpsC-like NDP-sugar epimerase